jgi:hypothetical protein
MSRTFRGKGEKGKRGKGEEGRVSGNSKSAIRNPKSEKGRMGGNS